jgi:hypothetical protein
VLTISRLSRWSINYYNDTARQASRAGLAFCPATMVTPQYRRRAAGSGIGSREGRGGGPAGRTPRRPSSRVISTRASGPVPGKGFGFRVCEPGQ